MTQMSSLSNHHCLSHTFIYQTEFPTPYGGSLGFEFWGGNFQLFIIHELINYYNNDNIHTTITNQRIISAVFRTSTQLITVDTRLYSTEKSYTFLFLKRYSNTPVLRLAPNLQNFIRVRSTLMVGATLGMCTPGPCAWAICRILDTRITIQKWGGSCLPCLHASYAYTLLTVPLYSFSAKTNFLDSIVDSFGSALQSASVHSLPKARKWHHHGSQPITQWIFFSGCHFSLWMF